MNTPYLNNDCEYFMSCEPIKKFYDDVKNQISNEVKDEEVGNS
jgi:hypothetical protein